MHLHRSGHGGSVDQRIAGITTPLKLDKWKQKLRSHPDQDFTAYVLWGMEHGFRIGIDSTRQMIPAKKNMLSANQNPEVIEKYIQAEVEKGNMIGPFSPDIFPSAHTNRSGVIPKKHQPGKWTDLSYPDGKSVNDSIDKQVCSMKYVSVRDVANTAVALGRGVLIAKIDIKAAYRLVPVNPQDRLWLATKWDGGMYIDCMLPFGLRSAPKIFNALADALEWVVAKEGVEHIYHYLDDYAMVGPPDSAACQRYLDTMTRVCSDLGIPLAPEKQEGPSTIITFLGIEIDTVRQRLQLPKEKLERLITLIHEWERKKACTRQE